MFFVVVVVCSKFWCRNRPGDEMKDGYNSLVSALVMTAETEGELVLTILNLVVHIISREATGMSLQRYMWTVCNAKLHTVKPLIKTF